MAEWQLFEPGTVPEYTTPEWYLGRDRAPHLDEEMHRPRLELAARYVAELAGEYGCASVVDLGAGDGGLLSLLAEQAPGLEAWGYDLQPTNVAGAIERGVHVARRDVIARVPAWGEIAVATEMLEHLLDPHAFIQRIARRAAVLVASSPWTETPEAHYGYHTWAWDQDGYRALLEHAGFQVARHEVTGMFQVIAGVVPR